MMWWRKRTDTVAPDAVLRCAFCNQHVGKWLIAGPKHVYICYDCVELCHRMVAERRRDAQQVRGDIIRDDDQPEGLVLDGETDVVMPWPEAIQCALCQASIQPDEGVLIAGRGTLCIDCVEAVTAQRSKL